MSHGLKPHKVKAIQEGFLRYPQIEKVILYGFRAKGYYRNSSHIDLTLKGKNLDLSLLLKLKNELDYLPLPHQVDLSIFHSIENPDLKAHINRVGIVFLSNSRTNSKDHHYFA